MHHNMILSSLLTHLRLIWVIWISFVKQFITAIETTRSEIYLRFIWIETYRIFFTSHKGYLLNTTLYVPGVGFSVAGSRSREIRIIRVISILLKTAFSQTSIHSQSPVKILWRSDKDKITFRAIEKHRYGFRKTVSEYLNPSSHREKQLKLLVSSSSATR